MKSSSFKEDLLRALADPAEAAAYLEAARADSPEVFAKAKRDVALAELKKERESKCASKD